MIFLNEIDPKKIKEFNISKGKLRAWYSILNIYKAALYNIYYKRPHNLDGYTILNKFRELLKTVKTIAAERGSSDMKHISLPSFSLSKYCPYQEIYKRVIEDTEDFRREDRKLGLRLPREEGFRTEHRSRQNNVRTISKQKRQILISNAPKRVVPNANNTTNINLAGVLRGQTGNAAL